MQLIKFAKHAPLSDTDMKSNRITKYHSTNVNFAKNTLLLVLWRCLKNCRLADLNIKDVKTVYLR